MLWRGVQYQPDFYLPAYDLYLEHFGIDEHGDTAAGIDRAAYHEGMAWKRALHEKYGTKLVETYSYFSRQGGLDTRLAAILATAGITPRPPTGAMIAALIDDLGRPFADFIDLLAQFLTLYRGSGFDPAMVTGRTRTARDKVFLRALST